ncbi:hypothetical protein [Bacillus sp. Marseille-Q3570]|uniref:hypothetical protein n=1 Tax=Bacillus sp. Marseille-Q3570 TaxID=2963522 RepID=UPI0021B7EFBB|nr:hypothetical protein [Bacillus sp. Marseille-Q3570]
MKRFSVVKSYRIAQDHFEIVQDHPEIEQDALEIVQDHSEIAQELSEIAQAHTKFPRPAPKSLIYNPNNEKKLTEISFSVSFPY